MWEINKGTTKCDKSTVTCDVVLHNVRMKPLNVRKKTTKYNKSIVKCDVRTVQYENGTLKCEAKKKREPPNVTKELLHMMLVLHNMRVKASNVRKIRRTTKCDESIIKYDVGTT